jgi:hypothetical protein
VRDLDTVQLGEPVAERAEGVRVGVAADRADLLGHGVATCPHEQLGAVRVAGAVRRIESHHVHVVRHRRTRRGEGALEDVDHGEHGRAGVEAVAVELEHPGTTAGSIVALHHGDVVSGPAQMAGSGQAAETGAHDDDLQCSRLPT